MKNNLLSLFILSAIVFSFYNSTAQNKKLERYMFRPEYGKIKPTDMIYKYIKKTGNTEFLLQFLNFTTTFGMDKGRAEREVKVLTKQKQEELTHITSLVEKGVLTDNISDAAGSYEYYWRKDYGFKMVQIMSGDTFEIAIMNDGGWKRVPFSLGGTGFPDRLTEREESNIKKVHPDFSYPRQFVIRPDLEDSRLKFQDAVVLNTGEKKYYCYKVLYNNNDEYLFNIDDRFIMSKTALNSSVTGVLYKSKMIYEDWKQYSEHNIFMPTSITEQLVDGNVSFIYSATSIECNTENVEEFIDHPEDAEFKKQQREKAEQQFYAPSTTDEDFSDEYEEPSDDIFDE